MSKQEYMKRLEESYSAGRISAEAYDAGLMNADIFCDDDDDECAYPEQETKAEAAPDREALLNLCFSCMIDGGAERVPITPEEAAYTLRCWAEEGNELAEETAGVSAEEFADAWNSVLKEAF